MPAPPKRAFDPATHPWACALLRLSLLRREGCSEAPSLHILHEYSTWAGEILPGAPDFESHVNIL